MKTVYPDRIEWMNERGELHRLDGPAVEYKNGSKYWFVNGILHRLDGPAREWSDGTKYWYQNDCLHRLDGPAIVTANGVKSWCINGQSYSEQEWFEALTLEQQTDYLFKLGEK